jgi:hypothetical protein
VLATTPTPGSRFEEQGMRFARSFAALGMAGLVATTAACSGSDAAPADPAAPVVNSFTAYSKAVTARDGGTAADLMTASSLSYYDKLRDLALDADRAELGAEPVVDQLTALSMRGDLSATDLRTLSPHDLVKKAVQINLISNGATPERGLQQVKIDGDTATAELVMTEGAQYPVGFTREAGQWKFDVTSLLQPAESALSQAREQQKLTERQIVDQVVSTRYGQAKVKELYQPVGR